MWYTYTMESYSTIKKDMRPFVSPSMELETLILREISQKEKNKDHRTSLITRI